MPYKKVEEINNIKIAIVAITKVNPGAKDSSIGRILHIHPKTIEKYRGEIEQALAEFITQKQKEQELIKAQNAPEIGVLTKFLERIGVKVHNE